MNIFRNINSTLIVSIGISALLCGAIIYYCNSRLNQIEFAIMRQNQVLSSFITNVQNEIRSGTKLPVLSEDVSTEEARKSAEKHAIKIVVSDDEVSDNNDSDDDEDDESDDSSSESDTEAEIEKNNNKLVNLNHSLEVVEIKQTDYDSNDNIHHIKIVDIQDLSMMFINEIKFDNKSMNNQQTDSLIYEIKDESSSESEDENDDDSTDVNMNETNVIDIDIKEEPKSYIEMPSVSTTVLPASVEKQNEQQPLKYELMRVDDLRKLVLDNQLSSKNEVKKLKKPELLFLLQQNTT
jgi:hypothetical protein